MVQAPATGVGATSAAMKMMTRIPRVGVANPLVMVMMRIPGDLLARTQRRKKWRTWMDLWWATHSPPWM